MCPIKTCAPKSPPIFARSFPKGSPWDNAPDRVTAENSLRRTVQKYSKAAPKLAAWLESDLPEGFTVFHFPPAHQRRLRTVNLLERANREIERRTRVVCIFPSEASCLRLISALLMELDEQWQTGYT
jgi:transposase-like protein